MKPVAHLLRLVDATQIAAETLRDPIRACLVAGETPSRIARTIRRNLESVVTETIAAHQFEGGEK